MGRRAKRRRGGAKAPKPAARRRPDPEARPRPDPAARPGPDPAARPGPERLALALALAAVHALWTLFQWTQLAAWRAGGESFCAFGEGEACAAIWDSAFASAVQEWTILPIAGWGLAWSLVALALPLLALVRRAQQRSEEPAWSATLWTALAGVVGVMVFAAASLWLGGLCTTCAVTYALVLAYAVVCFGGARALERSALPGGAGLAAAATLAAFLALLLPGLRTPSSPHAAAPELADAAPEDALAAMLARLTPEHRQGVSDLLARYAGAPTRAPRAPRALLGREDAPVRITEFSDALCGHCASLHRSLEALREQLPPDAFALEARHFPLDGACNLAIPRSSEDPVRCAAARAQICMEGREGAFEFAGALFRSQRDLTRERLFELAAPFVAREELDACMASSQTEAKLQDDIAWALEYGIQGTPLVLVNGREASAFPPLLYALVLARGEVDHPAFSDLPPASR